MSSLEEATAGLPGEVPQPSVDAFRQDLMLEAIATLPGEVPQPSEGAPEVPASLSLGPEAIAGLSGEVPPPSEDVADVSASLSPGLDVRASTSSDHTAAPQEANGPSTVEGDGVLLASPDEISSPNEGDAALRAPRASLQSVTADLPPRSRLSLQDVASHMLEMCPMQGLHEAHVQNELTTRSELQWVIGHPGGQLTKPFDRWDIVHTAAGLPLSIVVVGVAFALPIEFQNDVRWLSISTLSYAVYWVVYSCLVGHFICVATSFILTGSAAHVPWVTACQASFVGSLVSLGTYFSISAMWNIALDLPLPVPFSNCLVGPIYYASIFAVFWLGLAAAAKVDKAVKTRLRKLVLAFCVVLVPTYCLYYTQAVACSAVPRQWQWVLAPTVIAVREAAVRGVERFVGREDGYGDFACLFGAALSWLHAECLSVVMGSIATTETCIVLLVLDTGFNVFMTFKVWQLHNHVDQKKRDECEDRFSTMLQSETFEFLVPSAHLICFALIYNFPHAAKLPGVKLSLWHQKSVDDFSNYCQMMSIFIAVDAVSLIASGLLLYHTKGINIVNGILHNTRRLAWLQTLGIPFAILSVFSGYHPWSGTDGTLQFSWVFE